MWMFQCIVWMLRIRQNCFPSVRHNNNGILLQFDWIWMIKTDTKPLVWRAVYVLGNVGQLFYGMAHTRSLFLRSDNISCWNGDIFLRAQRSHFLRYLVSPFLCDLWYPLSSTICDIIIYDMLYPFHLSFLLLWCDIPFHLYVVSPFFYNMISPFIYDMW